MAALSDLGGRREYFGAIEREPDEPVFHEDWEGRVFGVAFFVETALGPPNLDAGRFNMEQLSPADYHASYYHRWFGGLERKLTAAGYLGEGEHDTKRGARLRRTMASKLLRRMLRPTLPRWMCAHVLPRMLGSSRPTWRRPRFAVGDSIRVRATQATGTPGNRVTSPASREPSPPTTAPRSSPTRMLSDDARWRTSTPSSSTVPTSGVRRPSPAPTSGSSCSSRIWSPHES